MIENWSLISAVVPLVGLAMVGSGADKPAPPAAVPAAQLPPLPYAQDALEPHVSAKTLSFHYGKHHQTYADTLAKLVADKPWAKDPLEKIVKESVGGADTVAVFNNAAQVWNHTFFWKCMKPGGGGKPTGRVLEMIEKSFGSYDAFKEQFVAAGLAQFGSGWVWLVPDGGKLKITRTANADTPIAHGEKPILTCDVWEHAYYLDYQNRRKDFVQTFLDKLVNWEFAASQL